MRWIISGLAAVALLCNFLALHAYIMPKPDCAGTLSCDDGLVAAYVFGLVIGVPLTGLANVLGVVDGFRRAVAASFQVSPAHWVGQLVVFVLWIVQFAVLAVACWLWSSAGAGGVVPDSWGLPALLFSAAAPLAYGIVGGIYDFSFAERGQVSTATPMRSQGLQGMYLVPAAARVDDATELLEHGRALDALAAAATAIGLYPADARAWASKAAALNALGQHQEALLAAERAIFLIPHLGSAWDSKIAAHNGLKQYDDALSALEHEQSLQATPLRWQLRAEALRGLGREREAQEAETNAKAPGD